MFGWGLGSCLLLRWESVMPAVNRCEVTKNMCGTDTWAEGYACTCAPCQHYLAATAATKVVTPFTPMKLQGFVPMQSKLTFEEVEDMKRNLETATTALQWYAAESNWNEDGCAGFETCDEGHEDQDACADNADECLGWQSDYGSVAFQALKKITGKTP